MWRTVLKFLLLFSLVTTLGCTIFSVGPYVLEFRYDPSATPTPLPSPIPNMPVSTPLPTPAPTSGTRPTAEVFPTSTIDVNAADLAITALTAIGSGVNPRCGDNTRVDFTVENRGVSAAAANVIYIADYNDFVITTEAYYGIPPLQPGESYSGSVNIVVGPPANVVHTLQAQVNSGFTVNEFNTANNYLAISYNVDDAGHCPPAKPAPTATVDASAGPNLVLIEVRLTASGINPRCGEAASIDFVVRNNGTAAVAATTLSLSDYVADTYESAGFVRVNLPALDVGATHNGSASILITHSPNVLHRLVVNVDDTSAVSEANEDDNVAMILYNVEDSGSCN
jgi:subtilase family serine protease